jgi:hypothetical protein
MLAPHCILLVWRGDGDVPRAHGTKCRRGNGGGDGTMLGRRLNSTKRRRCDALWWRGSSGLVALCVLLVLLLLLLLVQIDLVLLLRALRPPSAQLWSRILEVGLRTLRLSQHARGCDRGCASHMMMTMM